MSRLGCLSDNELCLPIQICKLAETAGADVQAG